MRSLLPEGKVVTMSEEIVFNSFRNSVLAMGVPVRCGNSYYLSDECKEDMAQLSLSTKVELAWATIGRAHDFWRWRPETPNMIIDEECANCLNIFVGLELAGPEVYNVWAEHFRSLFGELFQFEASYSESEYESQLAEMDALYPGHSPFLSNVFLVKRREFIEREKIVGKGDLYSYVSDMKNDVFGVVHEIRHFNLPAMGITVHEISRLMYYDRKGSFPFRLARQIILANGGAAPIDW